jgi:hypothetical protein
VTEQRFTICARKAVRRFTWVNASSGIGGGEPGIGEGEQGGPMCEACMSVMWEKLARFPVARETVTICPLGGVAA